MSTEVFQQQIEAFGRWKSDLVQQISEYQQWLEAHDMTDAEQDLRIFEMLEAVKSDHITIAFVAEVSCGKSELINAIFFANYKKRLLPSSAGRTTMCPTELFYDNKERKAYIRLLPIETRLRDISIAQYKRNPSEWSLIQLNVDSADEMIEAFHEVTREKVVPVEEARRLGLYDSWIQAHGSTGEPPSEIPIPKWRHALISFPHPLLEQGMVVLDTPGLNALGSEPELTLSMIPNAQAVLFLLSADTGVTKSDLDMWQHHITAYRGRRQKGLLVVLNKIDTLWDELKDDAGVFASIEGQRQSTAKMLQIDPANVFPVSAQKGLLAKVRGDSALLQRSGVVALENTLATDILPEKQRIIRDNVVNTISSMIENTRDILRTRLAGNDKQLGEFRNLIGKNVDVIKHLLTKTREEQATYNANVESLQQSRRALAAQGKMLLDLLSLDALDKVVADTRTAMSSSWTTGGLKKGMKLFFDHVHDNMGKADSESERILKLAQGIYQKFRDEHGFTGIKPPTFSTKGYVEELEMLYTEAEAFRTSPITTMTEQSHVIKRFFISLVSKARNIFFNAQHDAENWSKTVMSPLINQIRDHKAQIEKRLETLRKISESRDTLESKIQDLEKAQGELQGQIARLDTLIETVNRPLAGN